MCHLLTIGISGGSGNATEIFRAHGLHTEPAVNPHVRAAMPKNSILLDVTDDGCSCSIRARSTADVTVDEEAERARYARRGWSAAKIERAIQAKQAAHGRRKPNSKAQEFCLGVEALASAGAEIALISHLYSGLFAEEVVLVGARAQISLQDFLASLGTFPEDTLVTIR